MGGVNEALAVILMARKAGKPVCPHAGGVGLCEYVQHLSIFDYVALGGSLDDRVCEYVDHLHEHFVDPCAISHARYVAPGRPGYSIEIRPESIADHEFPGGRIWNRHGR
jgi:L-fuconate dehydratase